MLPNNLLVQILFPPLQDLLWEGENNELERLKESSIIKRSKILNIEHCLEFESFAWH